jgi:hypothetical protein
LQKYNGDTWSPAAVPTNTGLFTLWGTSDAVYSAGGGGVTLHYDGALWHVLRSGIPGDGYSILARSSTDFLVGGNHGSVYRYLDGEWTEQPLPGEGWRVTSLAGSGSHVFAGVGAGRVYQFDGTNWALSADSLGDVGDLAATPDGAAFAVGSYSASVFDGNTWRRINAGQNHFQQVWAQNKSVAFATAYEGVYRFEGSSWKRVLQNKQDRYQGIWGTAADDVYVAAGSIYHFDGQSWKDVFPGNAFELITGTSSEDVVAGSQLGMARFDGRIWSWSGDRGRGGDPIDIVPAHNGRMLRMYSEYLSSNSRSIVISQRVMP